MLTSTSGTSSAMACTTGSNMSRSRSGLCAAICIFGHVAWASRLRIPTCTPCSAAAAVRAITRCACSTATASNTCPRACKSHCAATACQSGHATTATRVDSVFMTSVSQQSAASVAVLGALAYRLLQPARRDLAHNLRRVLCRATVL